MSLSLSDHFFTPKTTTTLHPNAQFNLKLTASRHERKVTESKRISRIALLPAEVLAIEQDQRVVFAAPRKSSVRASRRLGLRLPRFKRALKESPPSAAARVDDEATVSAGAVGRLSDASQPHGKRFPFVHKLKAFRK